MAFHVSSTSIGGGSSGPVTSTRIVWWDHNSTPAVTGAKNGVNKVFTLPLEPIQVLFGSIRNMVISEHDSSHGYSRSGATVTVADWLDAPEATDMFGFLVITP